MLELNFSPFPELETKRMNLRLISYNDLNEVFYLRSTALVMQYIDKPLFRTHDEARAHITKLLDGIKSNTAVFWAMCHKGNSSLRGIISYHLIDKENYRAELGYILHNDDWGKGLTSEAVETVLNFGFQKMGLHSIEAKINPGNEASRKLLIKHQFRKEAYFRENFFANGKFLDTEVYSLIRPESGANRGIRL